MPRLVADRRGHVVTKDSGNSTAGLPGSDYVDHRWSTIQQSEKDGS